MTEQTATTTPTATRKLTRAEAGRLGGKATAAKYGAAHMQAIGRKGFAVTLAIYGAERTAELLAGSYLAKYGRPIDVDKLYVSRQHARVREAARRAYTTPQPCACGCGQLGEHRHHVNGLGAGNSPENIEWLAADCHHQHHIAAARALPVAVAVAVATC